MIFRRNRCILTLILLAFKYVIVLGDYHETSWLDDPTLTERSWRSLDLEDSDASFSGSNRLVEEATKPLSACIEDGVALVYYKKLVANLFKRTKLYYNKNSAQYERYIQFTVTREQLERLEGLSDARDLDILLAKIFTTERSSPPHPNVNTTYRSESGSGFVAETVWGILKYLGQLLKTSEVRFCGMFALVVCVGCFVNRRYRFGAIAIILGGFFIFGYLFTYLECNRKLEMEELLHVLKKQEKEQTPSVPRWYSPLVNWFSSKQSSSAALHEELTRSVRLNFQFCRPDHVLLLYANDLFLKQLEFLLEKCSKTLMTMRETLSFPFNYIASFMLLAMIGYILKLTFKYILSPRAWAALLHHSPAGDTRPLHVGGSAPSLHPSEDRLSGENLKMLLEAVNSPKILVNNVAQKATLSSGVQEVREELEAADSSTSSESTDGGVHDDKATLSLEEAQEPVKAPESTKT